MPEVYLSFVDGDVTHSGYKTGKDGERVYFYYHDLEMVKGRFTQSGFKDIQIRRVEYGTPETKKDMHTIITAFKEP